MFSNELTQGSLVKVLGWAGLGWAQDGLLTYGVPFDPSTQTRVLWCKWQL